MKKKKRTNNRVMRLAVCLALFFCTAMFLSCTAQPEKGSQAKSVTLPDNNGKSISLASLKGKVVLIDFWASWCRPCRQTVPGLKKLYSLYHDKGFEIYGISLDENKSAWQAAITQDQSTWIHVNDNSGVVANQWYISVIPTTFLLDKNGKIIAVDKEPKELSKMIEKLLR